MNWYQKTTKSVLEQLYVDYPRGFKTLSLVN